ncbi:ATP-binding protein [Embleya hyalina]|uniref:DNA mismatch repair protein MutL n=1 Tax=Embleya hyalina TaxID=516124 RepID=A0A401YYE8_9ACTN|nr:ATP-binding protein [Embleya hyalina]GCD99652.1 DNA mismatch repair protein MutL [Embleya hyalina]
MTLNRLANIAPSAARLTKSLRDIGYDFPAAVADLVDNSVCAGAERVEVVVAFDGAESYVMIADDGSGMSEPQLTEAMRFGSRRDYEPGDLGRYGLGLKTASLSQCRAITVATRTSPRTPRLHVRTLDLDLIAETDEWLVLNPRREGLPPRALRLLTEGTGTAVIWQKLDRVLPERRPEGGWARRRLEGMATRTMEHLGMVFHRFLTGTAGRRLVISVNGNRVEPWDPFAPDEAGRVELPEQRFEVTVGEAHGAVRMRRYVLPPKSAFSSLEQFDRLSGPLKWNRQQGLYIYRANRLVQWGGWSGIRSIDEHTKLARASMDFDTDLDGVFNIDVAKVRVTVPTQIRQMLERPINELCSRADETYRRASRSSTHYRSSDAASEAPWSGPVDPPVAADAGLALRAAAMHAGEYPAFRRIAETLRERSPEAARALGFSN